MTDFRYKAMDAAGRIVTGRMQASTVADVEARTRRMGLDLVDATPCRMNFSASRQVSRRDLINLYFALEQLLSAGVPLIDALVDLRDSVGGRRLRETLGGAIAGIEGGMTLSQAMAEQASVFDEVTVHLVQAGETSGRLPEVLADLVESLKWQDELAAQARRLAAYPLFLAALTVSLIVFVAVYLVPKITAFVGSAGRQLPWHTELLIAVSHFVAGYWPVVFGAPALLLVAILAAARRSRRLRLALDAAKLRLPLLGTVLRKIVLARFAAVVAMMYASGISVIDALRCAERIAGNAAIAAGLGRGRELIAEGAGIADALARTQTFPPLVLRMLRVGESSGGLDRALANVSYFYHRDVRESVERLQAMAEPVMTVIIGLVMGWVMLSVLAPVYDVVSGLKV